MPRRDTTKTAHAGKKRTVSTTPVAKPKSGRYEGIQLTSWRDVEQGTYTTQRSEQLRSGNVTAAA